MKRLIIATLACLLLVAPAWACDEGACRDEMQLAWIPPVARGIWEQCDKRNPDGFRCRDGFLYTENLGEWKAHRYYDNSDELARTEYSVYRNEEIIRLAWMNPAVLGSGSAAVVNGVIGSTTTSGNAVNTVAGKAFFGDFITTTAGTISYAHIYITASDQDETICACIWASDGSVKACSETVTINVASGWFNVALGSSVTIDASATYWIGFVSVSNVFSFDTGTFASGSPDTQRDNDASCGNAITLDALQASRFPVFLFNNSADSPT